MIESNTENTGVSKDFYSNIKMNNEIASQNSNDTIRIALTAKIASAITTDVDAEKIEKLMNLLDKLKLK